MSAQYPEQQVNIIDSVHPMYAQRRSFRANSSLQHLFAQLDEVFDPELPGLSLWDLGVLQNIEMKGLQVVVTITPTYSGCPAVDAMGEDITQALNNVGFKDVVIKLVLTPAWCTDMISPNGNKQLKALHIAPPSDDHIHCPVCNSKDTQVLSEFGSTACKAMYRCDSCMEVFDYFKKLA